MIVAVAATVYGFTKRALNAPPQDDVVACVKELARIRDDVVAHEIELQSIAGAQSLGYCEAALS